MVAHLRFIVSAPPHAERDLCVVWNVFLDDAVALQCTGAREVITHGRWIKDNVKHLSPTVSVRLDQTTRISVDGARGEQRPWDLLFVRTQKGKFIGCRLVETAWQTR